MWENDTNDDRERDKLARKMIEKENRKIKEDKENKNERKRGRGSKR